MIVAGLQSGSSDLLAIETENYVDSPAINATADLSLINGTIQLQAKIENREGFFIGKWGINRGGNGRPF